MLIRTPLKSLSVFFILITCQWATAYGAVSGWLSWRGPLQSGVSLEKDLPEDFTTGGEAHLWSYPIQGGGIPVVADGRAYVFGYYGETTDVQEALLCLDVKTGEKIWERRFNDYLSDIVYNRYAIGSPVVDAETGNVYLQTTWGQAFAFTRDGDPLWDHSMMEKYARLTFPNGRTGSPVIEGDLVIYRGITANWGRTGPARDRFYAFDKHSGDLVWYSTPGIRPVDSSYSTPVFADLGEQRVFYAGTGCGNVVCVNARTGAPVWRYDFSQGGVNATPILYGEGKLIVVHGKENLDSSTKGRLVCLKIPTEYPADGKQFVLGADAELWRNDSHISFSSSPALHGNRIYTTIATGSLLCTDADTGKTVWEEKLGPDQLHASPLWADGKLYVPFQDGYFFILRDQGTVAERLHEFNFGVPCLAMPMVYAGKVLLQTKKELHCFGRKEGVFVPGPTTAAPPPVGKITQLQIVPAEFALKPGGLVDFTVWGLDATGRRVKTVEIENWEAWIPATAKVKSKVDAAFTGTHTLSAGADAKLSAGAFKATWNGLSATVRGRVVAGLNYNEDFEGFQLTGKNGAGEAVAFPPLPWLGARVKWHALERDGSQVLANRLDYLLFQRTMNFFGSPDSKSYTLEADVMTDGTRRIMSTVGLVNQRYLVILSGNRRVLEISSNHERLKESAPFKIKPNVWYHLKTRVDTAADGSGVIRAKAWPREEAEPEAWTLEVPVEQVHPEGSPGVFAFSPQAQKRVYIDNLKITPNTPL